MECNFCRYSDGADRKGYIFYAGYTKQIGVDEFDEYETESITYCPICGRKLEH